MAYQTFFTPNPYTSYPAQYQSYQTFQQTPVQQPQPQSQMSSGIQWVQGKSAAQAFNVMPGQTVLLMDSDSPTLYLKSTDQSGRPMPMVVYDLIERKDPEASIDNHSTPNVDLSDYVKRADMEEYIRWSDLNDVIEQTIDKKMGELAVVKQKAKGGA